MPTEEKSCKNCGWGICNGDFVKCHDAANICADFSRWFRRPPKTPNQIREDLGMKPILKDSGNRTQFQTGAVRDMHQGKGRCDLLPPNALLRLARHFETGSLKYGDRNWELGIPCHSFADSGMRHLFKFMAGDTDEDHLIAAIWNLLCLAETEMLRPEMQDIPSRIKKDRMHGLDFDGDAHVSTINKRETIDNNGVYTAMDLLHTINDSKFCEELAKVNAEREEINKRKAKYNES